MEAPLFLLFRRENRGQTYILVRTLLIYFFFQKTVIHSCFSSYEPLSTVCWESEGKLFLKKAGEMEGGEEGSGLEESFMARCCT